MGASQRRKKLLGTARNRKEELLLQTEKLKKEIWGLESQALDLFGAMGEAILTKNEDGKSLLELLTDTGIHRYLLQSKALAEAVEEFYASEQIFVPRHKDEDRHVIILRALSNFIYKWLVDHDFDREEMLQKALLSVGFTDVSSNTAAAVCAYVTAREFLLQKTEDALLKKYMTEKEVVETSREVINSFLASYHAHLTGDALEAKREIDSLTRFARDELRRSFNENTSRIDYEAIAGAAIAEFDVARFDSKGKDQAIFFMELFERVREKLGPDQEELDNLSYLITEKMFSDFAEYLKKYPKGGNWKEDPYGIGPKEAFTLWTDSDLTKTGLNLWNQSYRTGGGDAAAIELARIAADRWGELVGQTGHVDNTARRLTAASVFQFTAKWAVHAFQRVTTTHTYAAALMCSDADRAVLDDIEMQWHAFMICVPNGLLKYKDDEDGTENEYNRILVARFETISTLTILNQTCTNSKHRLVTQVASNMAELLDVTDVDAQRFVHTENEILGDVQERVRRIVVLSKRLVTGLLLALQNRNNFKSKVYPARAGKHPRDAAEPEHRVVFVGAPLKIDCRPAIADYIQKGSHRRNGAPPQVQTLVRGHYKRQVVGVGRLGRKVIWIEPFWRGPEHAPILTKPKHIGP